MRSYNHGRFQQQASLLRHQFLQDGSLPFTNVLSEGIVGEAWQPSVYVGSTESIRRW